MTNLLIVLYVAHSDSYACCFYIECKEASTNHLTESIDISSVIDEIYAEQWQSILMTLKVNHLQTSLNVNKI